MDATRWLLAAPELTALSLGAVLLTVALGWATRRFGTLTEFELWVTLGLGVLTLLSGAAALVLIALSPFALTVFLLAVGAIVMVRSLRAVAGSASATASSARRQQRPGQP